jgi:dTDP-4-dehydrorhamnose reductase
MKITVFGSKGQLGQSLMDISFNYPQYNFLFTDIDTVDITLYRQVEDFVSRNHPKVLINCAAYTAVDKAQNDVKIAMGLNIYAAENIAKIAANYNIFFIHISTDYIFDGKKNKPYVEIDNVHPLSVYGRTKWKGESAIRKSLCHSAIIRTSWLYSEYDTNFVKTMLRLSDVEKELGVVFDQIGTPTYAHDLAEVIMQIINQKDKIEKSETFHYSNEGVASWYDFAVEIMRLKKRKCNIVPILSKQHPTPAKRPPYSLLDKQKIKDTFNITIPHWRDGLERCLKNM